MQLEANRGLSWDNALAYRDGAVSERAQSNKPPDKFTGFWVATRHKDQGQTGGPTPFWFVEALVPGWKAVLLLGMKKGQTGGPTSF
jgi:hypothetical protein